SPPPPAPAAPAPRPRRGSGCPAPRPGPPAAARWPSPGNTRPRRRTGRRASRPSPPAARSPATSIPGARAGRGCGGWAGGTAPPRAAPAAPRARYAGRAGAGRRDGAGRSSLPPAEQLLAQRPHVARAQGEHDVAFPDLLEQLLEGGLEIAGVGHLAVAAGGDGAGQRLGGDLGDRLLARRIDVGEPPHVGV